MQKTVNSIKKVQFGLQFAQDLIQFKLGFAKKCNILVKQKMQKFGEKIWI